MIKISIKYLDEKKDLICDEKRSIKSLLNILNIETTSNTAYLAVDNRVVDINNTLEKLAIKENEEIVY